MELQLKEGKQFVSNQSTLKYKFKKVFDICANL